MTAVDDAVEHVVATVNEVNDAGFRHDRLAVEWPSLAGALAELMNAYGRKPPGAWRRIARESTDHA